MKIKIKKHSVPRNVVGQDSSAAPAPVPAQSGPTLSIAPPSATAPPPSDGSKKPIKIKLKRKRDDGVGSSPAPVRHVAPAARQFPLTHAQSELSSLSHPELNGRKMPPPMPVVASQPAQPVATARPVKRIKLKVPTAKPAPAAAVGRIAIKKTQVVSARIHTDRAPAAVAHMPPPALPNRKALPAMHAAPATAPRIVPTLKPKIKIKKALPSPILPAAPVREPVAAKGRPPPRQRQAVPDVLPKRRKPQEVPGPSPSKKIKVKNGIKPVQSSKQAAVVVPQASAKPAPEPKVPVQPVEAVPLPEGMAFLEALVSAVPEDQLLPEKALLTMVNKLLRKDRENLFRTEPQKTNLPSRVKNAYKASIKQPIALATIRDYIRGLDGKTKLRTWKQMECALDLMVANCVLFNGEDSHLSKTARGIRAEFTRLRDKDAAAEAMAAAAPAEQAADFMPRLRSAMTETLPPRRAAVAASLARENTTKRGGGRGGGGRAPRVTHMTMRMLDTGIRRVIEPNARASYHKKEADFTTFGCTLGAWNLETGRSIWLTRPRLAHAYPKRYVPFGSAALKQAFHLGSMCGRLADLIKSNAAKTVFLPRKYTAPPPAPAAAAPGHQALQQHAQQPQQAVQVQAHHPGQAQQQPASQLQQQQATQAQQQHVAQAHQPHVAQAQQPLTVHAQQQRAAQPQQQQQGMHAQQQQPQQHGMHVQQHQQQQGMTAQPQQQQGMHAQQQQPHQQHQQQQGMTAQQQQPQQQHQQQQGMTAQQQQPQQRGMQAQQRPQQQGMHAQQQSQQQGMHAQQQSQQQGMHAQQQSQQQGMHAQQQSQQQGMHAQQHQQHQGMNGQPQQQQQQQQQHGMQAQQPHQQHLGSAPLVQQHTAAPMQQQQHAAQRTAQAQGQAQQPRAAPRLQQPAHAVHQAQHQQGVAPVQYQMPPQQHTAQLKSKRGDLEHPSTTGPSSPVISGTPKIKQKLGLVSVTAKFKDGKLQWAKHNKYDVDKSVGVAGQGISAWLQKRYWVVKCRVKDQIKMLFLPVGYPESTKENYLKYTLLAALAHFFMNTSATIGSTFLLYAAGLGRAEAQIAASAFNWIIKDLGGQGGTLMVGRMFSHDFDLNTRSWYCFANIIASLAAVVEISANSHTAYFIPIASAANTLKGISGLASSSTRAALNVSFARGENIADLTAKSHSQYIFSYLTGTFAGIFIAGAIDKADSLTAAYCCLALTAATAACSYAAIRTVPLANLNSSRLQLLLEHYTAAHPHGAVPHPIPLPRPHELCADDPVAPLSATPRSDTFWPPIQLNAPLHEIFPASVDSAPAKMRLALETHAAQPHLLVRDGRHRTSPLHVVLQVSATAEDAVMAMMHAVCVRKAIKAEERDVLELEEEAELIKRELHHALRHRTALITSLKDAHWNLTRVAIESRVTRGVW
eukprot:jgi/Ulvmu1/7068/UM033_0128.1